MGTCIKGRYRDKGINTSTKCGEFDGRSSSKSYLFGVSLVLPFSSLFLSRLLAHTQLLPLPFLSLPFSWFAFAPIPELSAAIDGGSGILALFDSRCSTARRLGSAIPPRQTRLGSILPNESRAFYPSLRRWKLERPMPCSRIEGSVSYALSISSVPAREIEIPFPT